MSRKLLLGLAIAVAVLVLGATTAVAHRTSFNTEIDVENVDVLVNGETLIRIEGDLISPKAACRPGRFVVAFTVNEIGEVTIIDSDVTDAEGDFFLQGPLPPDRPDAMFVSVARKNIGPPGHRHICQADTDRVSAN
jgi:hypothetical protein